MRFIKQIDIWKEYQKHAGTTWLDELVNHPAISEGIIPIDEKVNFDILINNNMDICVQISSKDCSDKNLTNHDVIYLYISWDNGFDPNQIAEEEAEMTEEEKHFYIEQFDFKDKQLLKSFRIIETNEC